MSTPRLPGKLSKKIKGAQSDLQTTVPSVQSTLTPNLVEPLMVTRHYVRNYFDLIQDTFERIYAAGDIDRDINILPGQTVGMAFNVTEESIGKAIGFGAGGFNNTTKSWVPGADESAMVGLIATMLTDAGMALFMNQVVDILNNEVEGESLPTFAKKADYIEKILEGKENADEIVASVRSVGKMIHDLVGDVFPMLDVKFPIKDDKDKEVVKSAQIKGPYTVVLSDNPAEVLQVEFNGGVISIIIKVKRFVLASNATFHLYKQKKDKPEKEKMEVLTQLVGTLFGTLALDNITLTLNLDDYFSEKTEYPWAPDNDVHWADFTRPSISPKVSSVSVELPLPSIMLILAALGGLWTFAIVGTLSILEQTTFEGMLADAIRDGINKEGSLDDLQPSLQEYVTPIAQAIIPIAHGYSTVRYRDIWALGDAPRHIKFERLTTGHGPRSVSLRNAVEDEQEDVHGDPDNPRFPDEDDDTIVGRRAAPAKQPAGAPRPKGQRAAMRTPRPASAGFAAGGPTSAGEVHAQVPFSDDVWKRSYEPVSPIDVKLGSSTDPSWIALSTNCVAATELYRALLSNGRLIRSGNARHGGGSPIAYEVTGVADIAADFTGTTFGGAPSLAVRQLDLTLSGVSAEDVGRYTLDFRVRLRPTLPGNGCLPSDAVEAVLHNMVCLESMTGGEFPDDVRSKQIEQRNFLYLEVDLAYNADDPEAVQPIQILRNPGPVRPAGSSPSHSDDQVSILRDVLRDWALNLPAAPILYNSFAGVGATLMSSACDDGWIVVRARYPFPDFSDVEFD